MSRFFVYGIVEGRKEEEMYNGECLGERENITRVWAGGCKSAQTSFIVYKIERACGGEGDAELGRKNAKTELQ